MYLSIYEGGIEYEHRKRLGYHRDHGNCPSLILKLSSCAGLVQAYGEVFHWDRGLLVHVTEWVRLGEKPACSAVGVEAQQLDVPGHKKE